MDGPSVAISPPGVRTGDSSAWLLDAGDEETLKLVAESAALADGKVALVSLAALRTRLGPRWAPRQELVHEHAERAIAGAIGPDGFFVRLSEIDYLVAQPDTSPLTGQVACFKALRSTLAFFLGESLNADVVVHQITAITEGAIEGRRLDVPVVEETERAERTALSSLSDDAAPMSLERWTPFVASDGRRVRVSCALEPLVHLKTFAPIGYRIRRRVMLLPQDTPLSARDQSLLSRADIERIDMATLLRGLDRLATDAGAERQPSLVLPVSYASLTGARSRLILQVFEQAQSRVRTGLLCEICDIEGVAPAALLAAASLIRHYCLFVIGRLNEMPTRPLSALRNAGLHALSFDWPGAAVGEAAFIHEMRGLVAMTKSASKTLFVYQVPSARQAAIAAHLGVTHATIRSPDGS